jgi:hypothetical protein
MTQALYAHVNKKTNKQQQKKPKKRINYPLPPKNKVSYNPWKLRNSRSEAEKVLWASQRPQP